MATGDHAHLLIHRFDLEDNLRRHQHTLGGLLHIDHNHPGASSYEEYLRTVLRLGMPYASVAEAYRRAIFNCVAVNQDDHVKNLSFLMREDGGWQLAPAYDITFARGEGYTARHQMRVRDKLSGITRADLLALGEEFGINDPPAEVAAAYAAIARFEEFTIERKVPREVTQRIRAELDRRRKELD